MEYLHHVGDSLSSLVTDTIAPHLPNALKGYVLEHDQLTLFGPSEGSKPQMNLLSINKSIADVKGKAGDYSELFEGEDAKRRKEEYSQLVDNYYNLATDFYLFGWGQNFHFAPRMKGESLDESLRRHEYYLASRLGLEEGMKVLDCGCGVGGPARNIARFSGAHVTGISLNQHQIDLGNSYTREQGLSDLVSLRQGDFMKLPFPDNHFDAVYAIEATCHAPDRTKCFSEIYRVLKPGGYFGCYEWVKGRSYQNTNREHAAIKYNIEIGNGLPDLTGPSDVHQAVVRAGFESPYKRDLSTMRSRFPVPWYQPFLDGWMTTPVAIFITNKIVWALESLRILPTGTHLMHSHLAGGAHALVEGGKRNLFTPMLFVLARKPEDASNNSSSGRKSRSAQSSNGDSVSPLKTRSKTPTKSRSPASRSRSVGKKSATRRRT